VTEVSTTVKTQIFYYFVAISRKRWETQLRFTNWKSHKFQWPWM